MKREEALISKGKRKVTLSSGRWSQAAKRRVGCSGVGKKRGDCMHFQWGRKKRGRERVLALYEGGGGKKNRPEGRKPA